MGFLCISFNRFKKRCKKCKKWGAYKTIEKKFLQAENTTVIKTEDIKDDNGNITETKEKEVPSIINSYEIFEKCKYCGNIKSFVKEEIESS